MKELIVFIAYAGEDENIAKEIKEKFDRDKRLQEKNVDIWVAANHNDQSGTEWEKEMYQKVKKCSIMIIVATDNLLNTNPYNSKHGNECYAITEIKKAECHGKKIIPYFPNGRKNDNVLDIKISSKKTLRSKRHSESIENLAESILSFHPKRPFEWLFRCLKREITPKTGNFHLLVVYPESYKKSLIEKKQINLKDTSFLKLLKWEPKESELDITLFEMTKKSANKKDLKKLLNNNNIDGIYIFANNKSEYSYYYECINKWSIRFKNKVRPVVVRKLDVESWEDIIPPLNKFKIMPPKAFPDGLLAMFRIGALRGDTQHQGMSKLVKWLIIIILTIIAFLMFWMRYRELYVPSQFTLGQTAQKVLNTHLDLGEEYHNNSTLSFFTKYDTLCVIRESNKRPTKMIFNLKSIIGAAFENPNTFIFWSPLYKEGDTISIFKYEDAKIIDRYDEFPTTILADRTYIIPKKRDCDTITFTESKDTVTFAESGNDNKLALLAFSVDGINGICFEIEKENKEDSHTLKELKTLLFPEDNEILIKMVDIIRGWDKPHKK